jgi:uracil-DNA glycosylase family 4
VKTSRYVGMIVGSVKDLEEISEAIAACQRCRLAETRIKVVPGEGSYKAEVMFIGEAPGKEEDLQGRPFVGRAGKLLDGLLAEIEIGRSEVFIGNVLKCRPTSSEGKDRKPTEQEVSACSQFLDSQIEKIKPKVICTLGDTATQYILRKYGLKPDGISKIHGKVFEAADVKIIPLYHPAAALYTYRLERVIREDFKRLKSILDQRTLEGFVA